MDKWEGYPRAVGQSFVKDVKGRVIARGVLNPAHLPIIVAAPVMLAALKALRDSQTEEEHKAAEALADEAIKIADGETA